MPREGEEKLTRQEITRKKKKKKKQDAKKEECIPKGDHVPKGTVDVNEAEEWIGNLREMEKTTRSHPDKRESRWHSKNLTRHKRDHVTKGI